MRPATIIAHLEHVLANHGNKQNVMVGASILREVIRELDAQRGRLTGLREALRISERKLPRHSRDMLNEIARRSFHDNARSYCIGAAETQEAIINNLQDRIVDLVNKGNTNGEKLEDRMDASHV